VNRKISGIISEKTRPKGLTVPVPSSKPGSKTVLPTIEATESPIPTPKISLPASITLTNIRHEYQTWNNCGPATLAMNLSYFKSPLMQKDLAPLLKPDSEDKNVSPNEMVDYINSTDEFGVLYAVNGNMTVIKQLLANNFPVIIETWFILHPDDQMGHYELTRGYNDNTKQFLMYDSYRGPNIRTSYTEYDENWKVFDRTFIVIYEKKDEEKLKKLIPQYFDNIQNLQDSLRNSQSEVAKDPNDMYAYFNLGTTLSKMERHEEAAVAFDKARSLKLPWRMLWYQFEIFDTYLALGRYDDVISLTNANLAQANNLEESLYYRGQAYEKTGKTEEAKRDYAKAIQYNKNYTAAKDALEKLQ
jgi:tetratricopeptide (TPR) repeat protein